MSFGKKLIAAAAASVMMIGSASADWNGLYAGTFAGVTKAPGGGSIFSFNVGAQAGFNFVPGSFLVGVNFDAGASIIGGAIFIGDVTGTIRLGGFISPDVLLYTAFGFGTHFPYFAGTNATVLGAGAEVAIGTNLGLFGELRRYRILGGPPASAYSELRIGMNFHQ
jgi:hypothetical protein